jgi:hypothetical protein
MHVFIFFLSLALFYFLFILCLLLFAFLLLQHVVKVFPEVFNRLEVSLLHALQYFFVSFQLDECHMSKVLIKHS